MKVKELIADLQKCEQNAEVYMVSYNQAEEAKVVAVEMTGDLSCVDLLDPSEYARRVSILERKCQQALRACADNHAR